MKRKVRFLAIAVFLFALGLGFTGCGDGAGGGGGTKYEGAQWVVKLSDYQSIVPDPYKQSPNSLINLSYNDAQSYSNELMNKACKYRVVSGNLILTTGTANVDSGSNLSLSDIMNNLMNAGVSKYQIDTIVGKLESDDYCMMGQFGNLETDNSFSGNDTSFVGLIGVRKQ